MDLNKFSPEKLQEIANRNGITVEELLANNTGGKQDDLTETDPPTSQNTETSAGESSSGDISLGSPEPKIDRLGKYIYRGEEQTILESDYLKNYAGKTGYPKTFDGFIKGWKGAIQETTIMPEVKAVGAATEEMKDLQKKAKDLRCYQIQVTIHISPFDSNLLS